MKFIGIKTLADGSKYFEVCAFSKAGGLTLDISEGGSGTFESSRDFRNQNRKNQLQLVSTQ